MAENNFLLFTFFNTILTLKDPVTRSLMKTSVSCLYLDLMLSADAINMDKAKMFGFGKELTFSQTTNFKLLQTERVCRRQFQI